MFGGNEEEGWSLLNLGPCLFTASNNDKDFDKKKVKVFVRF